MNNSATRLNQRSAALCDEVLDSYDLYDVRGSRQKGVRIIDFASDRAGHLSGGLMLARICMADLGTVRLAAPGELGLPMVEVQTDHPLWACIGAQYAGWPFSVDGYFAMGSGPARMARGEEELLLTYGMNQPCDQVVAVFESDKLPGVAEVDAFLAACNAKGGQICVAKTASLPGSIQVVARSIETTMHKLHELNFDLRRVRNAMGSAPLPPIPKDDLTALGWTNDAILYGGETYLWMDIDDAKINEIGPQIPSCHSSEFGRPFLEIFEQYERDFYKIDRMLFSPAKVTIQSLLTGNRFSFGEVRNDILEESFGLSAGAPS